MQVILAESYEQLLLSIPNLLQGDMIVRDWNCKRWNARILKKGTFIEFTRRLVIGKDDNPVTKPSPHPTLKFARVITQHTDSRRVVRKFEGYYLSREVSPEELNDYLSQFYQ